MSAVLIRAAEPQDLPQLATLFDAYRQFYEQASDLEHARAFLSERLERQQSQILLATDAAGQAIGFCQLYPSFCSVLAAPIYVLYDLFVTPTARRSGAGRALMQAAEQHALRQGMARMDLTTAKTNGRAQALYESLGWQRDEVFYAYNKTPG